MLQRSESNLHDVPGRRDHTRSICSKQIAGAHANKCDAGQKGTWRAIGVITAAVLACFLMPAEGRKKKNQSENLEEGDNTRHPAPDVGSVFIGY